MSLFRGIFSFLPVLFSSFPLTVSSQTFLSDSSQWNYVKLNNDLTGLLKPIGSESGIEITFFINVGSVYETDTLQGISHVVQTIKATKIKAYLEQNNSSHLLKDIVFNSFSTTEHSIFKFKTNSTAAGECFKIMRDLGFLSGITEDEVNAVKRTVLQEADADKNNSAKVFEKKILKRIYRQDYKKLSITGDSSTVQNITPTVIADFAKKYYVVNNTVVSVAGNFQMQTLYPVFETTFNTLKRGEFNPEGITKMIHYRPMIYSSQFVMEDSVNTPEFHICWQFPGVNVNEQASFSAYLLTTILNDPNNFIQVKAKQMGCRKLIAEYDANNFTGVFRIVLQPDKNNFYPTFSFVLSELKRFEKTLANESMINAGKIQFRNRYNLLKTTKYFPEKGASYMVYKEESFYSILNDSVWSVTEKNFKLFIRDYLNDNPHVIALKINSGDRKSLNTDSVFSEIDENIAKYVFHYRQNITDLEGEENTTLLNNLLQWLRMNEDVYLQVNGFSDEGEYHKAKSDTIMKFIDLLPSFSKSKSELIKKGYLRPNLMRAMKIVKYLYDNGIAAERLSGTGMQFSSDTDEQAIENSKCTLTIDKMHQSQSLYEKYYGKKKE